MGFKHPHYYVTYKKIRVEPLQTVKTVDSKTQKPQKTVERNTKFKKNAIDCED